MSKVKSIATLSFFLLLVLLAIVIPTILLNNKRNEEESFPEAQKIEVIEEEKTTPEKTVQTRRDLENDVYFLKFANSPDYNYKNVREEIDPLTGLKYPAMQDGYLKNMIINFIYNYQLTNTSRLARIDYEDGVFCMTPSRVEEALEELYYSEISLGNFLEYFPGYFDYVTKEGKNYCFNFSEVSKMDDSLTLVGIKQLSVSNQKIITADTYIFKFYTMDTAEEVAYTNSVRSYIAEGKFSNAADIVRNQLSGEVSHRKIVFRINKNRKYYTYQLLYSAPIN